MAEIPVAVAEALADIRGYLTTAGAAHCLNSLNVVTAHVGGGARAGEERARAIEECARIADAMVADQRAEAARFEADDADVWSMICGAHADIAEALATQFRALAPPAAPERGESPCPGCRVGLAICPHHEAAHHVSQANRDCQRCLAPATDKPPDARPGR